MQNLQPFIDSLQKFAQKRLDFREPPKLFLKQDQENAKNVFGKTAYYDPNEKSITIFTTGRHPKDILRSIAHELVHHCQNLRGDLSPEKCGQMGTDYAQKNDHMREMEREAYEKGNLCFRDWEDGIKVAMQQENNQLKENKQMVKISKKELKGLIGKILEARMKKEKVEENEDLEEDHCFKRNDSKKKMEENEELEEGKGEECAKCKGKGCDHCDGKGYHKKELEEAALENPKKADLDKDGKLSPYEKRRGAAIEKSMKDQNESKIQTPEQEQKLYESRFNKRNEEIFDKLKKLWTK